MLTNLFSQYVSDYANIHIATYNHELNSYNIVKNIDELLKRSVYSDYRLGLNPQKSHQYCIADDTLSDMYHYCKITKVTIDLINCRNFEEILKVLYYPRQIKLIPGFGSMCIYDSCLRIGVNTSVTFNSSNGKARAVILPVYVYVHNGSEDGAKNLFKSMNVPYKPKYHSWDKLMEFPYFQQSDFPAPLNTLWPHHIENFLCIYKDQL